MIKRFFLYDKFFVRIQNFTIYHVKIVKVQGFYSFFLTSQIPGFLRIVGFVAIGIQNILIYTSNLN